MIIDEIETINAIQFHQQIDKEMVITICSYIDEIMKSVKQKLAYRIITTTYGISFPSRSTEYIASYYGLNKDYAINIYVDTPSIIEIRHGSGCTRNCPHKICISIEDGNCDKIIKNMVRKV